MMLKIDMHVHTSHSDSSGTVDEVLETARGRRLDGLAITDHNTMDGVEEALRKRGELIIIPGEEVKTRQGEILAIGISRPIPKDLPITEAIRRTHQQGGLVVIPHPTVPFLSKLKESEIRRLKIDGLEVFSAITPLPGYFLRKNLEMARRLNLPILAGSDSHSPETVGDAYTLIHSESRELSDILNAIKHGRTEVGCHPSKWRFKVKMVPSFLISAFMFPFTYRAGRLPRR